MNRLFFKLGTTGYALGYIVMILLKNRLALAILLVARALWVQRPTRLQWCSCQKSPQPRTVAGRWAFFGSAASLGWAISVEFTGFIINELGGGYFFSLCSLLYSASLALVHLFSRVEDRHASDAKE